MRLTVSMPTTDPRIGPMQQPMAGNGCSPGLRSGEWLEAARVREGWNAVRMGLRGRMEPREDGTDGWDICPSGQDAQRCLAGHVGQSKIATGIAIGQSQVIKAHQVEQRRVEIVNM